MQSATRIPPKFSPRPSTTVYCDRSRARSVLRDAALLPTTGPDANAIAPHFGKRTKKRLTEIDQILTSFKNPGKLRGHQLS